MLSVVYEMIVDGLFQSLKRDRGGSCRADLHYPCTVIDVSIPQTG